MAYDLQAQVAQAERLALPFMARPINMYRCPAHPAMELKPNFAGLLICPHRDHWPDRGDDKE